MTKLGKLKSILTISSAIAFATSTQAAEPESREREVVPGALDIITVTARRVEENLQTVPITVNVLTEKALESNGIQNLSEISNIIPNVVWTNNSSTVRLGSGISIRGIKSGDSLPAFDPGVGFYIDDVYQASGTSFENSLLDISEIQVLKGPQGTLFGRNTTAGAILIRTRLPATDEVYGKGDVEFGNYGLKQFRAAANIPLSDKAALKVSGIFRERDGYNLNTVTGRRDVNNENHLGGQVQLLVAPSEQLEVVLRAHWYRDRTSGQTPTCYGPGAFGNLCPENSSFEDTLDRMVAANPPNVADRDMWGSSLNGTWTTEDGYEITSVTAYGEVETTLTHDGDFTSSDLNRTGGVLTGQWQFSQELRVATPQEGRLRGVAGLYYMHENKPINIPLTFTPAQFPLIGLSDIPPSPYAQPQSTSTDALTKTNSYAIFGQGQFEIAPRITLEAGLRYTRDEKDFMYEQTVDAALIPLIPFGIPSPFAPLSNNESWGAFTGTGSISFEISDSAMTYFRYARGYKSGGFNANTSSPDQDPSVPFDPEYVDSYELGVKYETPNRNLRVNLAAFKIDYKDLQVQVVDPLTRIKFIGNESSASSQGVEAEITFAPFENFTLTASGGYQDVKAENGSRLTNTPKFNASANASYSFAISPELEVVTALTTIFRDKIYLDGANTLVSPSFVQMNIRAGIESDNWGVYFWANNLTNVSRVIDLFAGLYATGHTYINPPRTFGLGIKGSF